jgi:hypothetical protein
VSAISLIEDRLQSTEWRPEWSEPSQAQLVEEELLKNNKGDSAVCKVS